MSRRARDIAGDAASRDPEVGLRAVVALRKLLEQLEALQVRNARQQGWTWQEIADRLEVSRQAVHKKFAGSDLSARIEGLAEALRDFLQRSGKG